MNLAAPPNCRPRISAERDTGERFNFYHQPPSPTLPRALISDAINADADTSEAAVLLCAYFCGDGLSILMPREKAMTRPDFLKGQEGHVQFSFMMMIMARPWGTLMQ